MKEELKQSEALLNNLFEIHIDNAKEYSYKCLIENRFNGEEKTRDKNLKEALYHAGKADGLRASLAQIRNILNTHS